MPPNLMGMGVHVAPKARSTSPCFRTKSSLTSAGSHPGHHGGYTTIRFLGAAAWQLSPRYRRRIGGGLVAITSANCGCKGKSDIKASTGVNAQ